MASVLVFSYLLPGRCEDSGRLVIAVVVLLLRGLQTSLVEPRKIRGLTARCDMPE